MGQRTQKGLVLGPAPFREALVPGGPAARSGKAWFREGRFREGPSPRGHHWPVTAATDTTFADVTSTSSRGFTEKTARGVPAAAHTTS